jgi:S-formylglutathione hydrolase FrmB
VRIRFATERIRSPKWLLRFGLVIWILLAVPAGVTRLASSDVRDYPALRGTISMLRVRGPGDTHPFPLWVWRPPGPDSASIPVIYFLHGYPGAAGDACSAGLVDVLNRRLEEGYPPVVVACPDGNGEHHQDTEWANAWNGSDRMMSRVIADIAAVEGTHRRPAALRVIAGFSMGGYGAMNIAMQNRGLFGSVVSISGYFVLNDLSDMFGDIPAVMAANDPSAHPARARGMNVILEEDAQDPLRLIRGQAAWMGRLLSRAGVPAVVRIMPGSHTWSYALRAFQDALTYLDADWQRAAAREAVAGLTAALASGATPASPVQFGYLRMDIAMAWRLVARATSAPAAVAMSLLR